LVAALVKAVLVVAPDELTQDDEQVPRVVDQPKLTPCFAEPTS
jgi:hypothetical protein